MAPLPRWLHWAITTNLLLWLAIAGNLTAPSGDANSATTLAWIGFGLAAVLEFRVFYRIRRAPQV